MSDKTMYRFIGFDTNNSEIDESIESRGYKKAVKSFQNKYPKLQLIYVNWIKDNIKLSKLQKLPMGRKKKLGG